MLDEQHERLVDGEDRRTYWRFTGPARLQKSLNTLHGILRGIAADGVVNQAEHEYLAEWVLEHAEFVDRHPFNELVPALQAALADYNLTQEEALDLVWLCDKLNADGGYYAAVTADMQRLQGVLAGIAADRKVNELEIRELRRWLDDHAALRGCWPYDEVCSVLTAVLADQKITEEEQRDLLSFFSEFACRDGHRAIDCFDPHMPTTARGICALSPEIAFDGQVFCFTGKASRGTREELVKVVERLGGRFHPRVCQEVNYLVVGAAGNEAWAFACYGRKVEQAVELRKAGHSICLVHEFDFWDEVADRGC